MTVEFLNSKKPAAGVVGPQSITLGKTGKQAKPPAIDHDTLIQVANEIENLEDQKDAFDKLAGLKADNAMTLFKLGGVLSKMNSESWFGPYGSLKELCEVELGFSQSKAYYLMTGYETILSKNVPWSVVEEVGWSKTALLCSKHASEAINEEEFYHWLQAAKSTSHADITAELKGHHAASGDKPKVLVFKPHPDQAEVIDLALAIAKSEGETEVDTVALDFICGDFLAGHEAKPSVAHAHQKLKQMMGIVGPEQTLNAFKEQFPDWGVSAWKKGQE